MSKNKISSEHHTIPQFYLNNFAKKVEKGYWIYRYNKNLLKELPDLVKNVGFIKNFNTIEIEGNKTDIFEKLHNEVFEKGFSNKLEKIVGKIEQYNKCINYCYNCMSIEWYEKQTISCISYRDKEDISYLLSYFILRSRKLRNVEELFIEKMKLIHYDMYKANGITNEEKIQLKIEEYLGNEESVKKEQLYSLFKGNSIVELAKIIYNHVWIIGYSDSELLYTSDNGHALTGDGEKSIGYNTYGNVIFFPLTSKICIIMYDVVKFREVYKDLMFVNLNSIQINEINKNIVFDGIDEIYSKDGDWTCLENYYKNNNLPKGHKPYGVY